MQSTLILSKTDGSIIRSTGLLAEPTSADDLSLGNSSLNGDGYAGRDTMTDGGSRHGESRIASSQSAESVARMVFSFVSGAQEFVEGMDATDNMRLLRLRTRRNEIVIVPGQCSMTPRKGPNGLLIG